MKNAILIIVTLFFSITLKAQKAGDCVSGNCINGNGTMLLEKGDTYTGEFKNGKMDGIGKIVTKKGKYKNAGLFSNGSPVEMFHFNDTSNDVKYFYRDCTQGSTNEVYSFDSYTGKVREYYWIKYSTYQEDYVSIDMYRGIKTTVFHYNTSTDTLLVYEGYVVNGLKEGFGVEVKHVEIKDKNPLKPSVFYWELYEGQFKKGKRNGLGHKVKRNGKLYNIGEYKDGEYMDEKKSDWW